MAGQDMTEQVQSTLRHASALLGEELGEAEYAPMAVAVGAIAKCYCNREDIPEGMQAAVGALLVAAVREQRREGVASVTRGDTAVTYQYHELFELLPVLAPWRRLGTVQREA